MAQNCHAWLSYPFPPPVLTGSGSMGWLLPLSPGRPGHPNEYVRKF